MSNVKMDFKTIQQIARLAKLSVTEEQAQEHAVQMTKIMGFFNSISAISTNGTEPLITPTEIENFWRNDESENNFSSEEMVANAPSRQGSLFKVPPVV